MLGQRVLYKSALLLKRPGEGGRGLVRAGDVQAVAHKGAGMPRQQLLLARDARVASDEHLLERDGRVTRRGCKNRGSAREIAQGAGRHEAAHGSPVVRLDQRTHSGGGDGLAGRAHPVRRGIGLKPLHHNQLDACLRQQLLHTLVVLPGHVAFRLGAHEAVRDAQGRGDAPGEQLHVELAVGRQARRLVLVEVRGEGGGREHVVAARMHGHVGHAGRGLAHEGEPVGGGHERLLSGEHEHVQHVHLGGGGLDEVDMPERKRVAVGDDGAHTCGPQAGCVRAGRGLPLQLLGRLALHLPQVGGQPVAPALQHDGLVGSHERVHAQGLHERAHLGLGEAEPARAPLAHKPAHQAREHLAQQVLAPAGWLHRQAHDHVVPAGAARHDLPRVLEHHAVHDALVPGKTVARQKALQPLKLAPVKGRAAYLIHARRG